MTVQRFWFQHTVWKCMLYFFFLTYRSLLSQLKFGLYLFVCFPLPFSSWLCIWKFGLYLFVCLFVFHFLSAPDSFATSVILIYLLVRKQGSITTAPKLIRCRNNMTAIDMLFVERNPQEERFRQKDNEQKTPVFPWKAVKENSFTE